MTLSYFWPCVHCIIHTHRTVEARDVKCWFAENDLLLNADKSEVMMIGTPTQLRLAENIGIVTVDETSLTLSTQVKSLGVIFDPKLSFDSRVCNYLIWALQHIRSGECCL